MSSAYLTFYLCSVDPEFQPCESDPLSGSTGAGIKIRIFYHLPSHSSVDLDWEDTKHLDEISADRVP